MSFRLRLTIVAAVAVAVAIAAASAVVYGLVRSQLRGEVDDSLRARAAALSSHGRGPALELEPDPATGRVVLNVPGDRGFDGTTNVFAQAVRSDRQVAPARDQVEFPVPASSLEVARGERAKAYADATVRASNGRLVHVRMLTVPAGVGFGGQRWALQLVRPLDEVDRLLDRVRVVLLLIALVGVVVAAAVGAVVAGAALAPVRRLTRQAELVAETQDLDTRIDVRGRDELSRLGGAFNTMLGALGRSQRAQRQLVADASHELRTPLTSLRTNIEVLARSRDMPDDRREALLRDVTGQLEEMTTLVSSLVELAAEAPADLETTEIRLDELAGEAVARARRLAPQVPFRTDLRPSTVDGVPSRLERAIANLLDNAVKWSPPGAAVEVGVDAGEVTVRDHGPGIAEEDRPHVFDHFYRSAAARSLPGSGLGLAIVRQVAEQHGGSVAVDPAPGGGTVARLRLPETNGRRPEAS